MSRNIFNVIVDTISLLEGMDPAVPKADTKFALLKRRKPKITAEIKSALGEIEQKNREKK